MLEASSSGCILRIASKQWVEQVFNMLIYYTNLRRKWKPGQTILFLHKTRMGDAFVGYGLVENTYKKDELSEHERCECEKGHWKRALEFRYVKQFEKPLYIKETFLKDTKLRGRYLHGLSLAEKQIKSIVAQAEG